MGFVDRGLVACESGSANGCLKRSIEGVDDGFAKVLTCLDVKAVFVMDSTWDRTVMVCKT
jgi:hypothetical protein